MGNRKGYKGKSIFPIIPEQESQTEPKSISKESNNSSSIGKKEETQKMFNRGFLERRDLEQYFLTDKTMNGILKGLRFTFTSEESCCLCTPTLADAFWKKHKAVSLLDIDTRFDYLPKYHYFDLRYPHLSNNLEPDQDLWTVIVFDPPFFYISMEVLLNAVVHICKGRVERTKILIGFLKREEKTLLKVFKSFNLKITNFPLEYTNVKANKWRNYALYSNIMLLTLTFLVLKE